MEPLHTHMEYERAKIVIEMLCRKKAMIGLSENEEAEYGELYLRTRQYEIKYQNL